MKIVFVTPGFFKRGEAATGFPNYLYRISLALIEMGHQPIILTAGNWNERRIERGIDVRTVCVASFKVKNRVLNTLMDYLFTSYALNKELSKIIQSEKIDIVQFTSLKACALFYKEKVPAVLRLSSYANLCFRDFLDKSIEEVKMMGFLERLSARRCNAIFAPSQMTANAYAVDCRRKVRVIETPFINDVVEYDNKYINEILHNKKYVLYFGKLEKHKGITVIAEIIEEFLEKNKEYNFVFVGRVENIDGENSGAMIKRRAGKHKDRVILLGELQHKQLYPIIQKADFVILPSYMDNLSNACIEAMYFNKIVIGTQGASFEQLITHGTSGFLCEIGNSRDLYEKMQQVVDLTATEKRLIEENAGKRIERLRPEYVVKKLLKFYEYVICNY